VPVNVSTAEGETNSIEETAVEQPQEPCDNTPGNINRLYVWELWVLMQEAIKKQEELLPA